MSETAVNGQEMAAPVNMTPSPLNGVVPPVASRYKKGHPGGPGRPVLDPVAKALREAEREKRLAAQWLADLESHDPEIRLQVRKDLMDRVIGRPVTKIEARTENYYFVEEIDRDWEDSP